MSDRSALNREVLGHYGYATSANAPHAANQSVGGNGGVAGRMRTGAERRVFDEAIRVTQPRNTRTGIKPAFGGLFGQPRFAAHGLGRTGAAFRAHRSVRSSRGSRYRTRGGSLGHRYGDKAARGSPPLLGVGARRGNGSGAVHWNRLARTHKHEAGPRWPAGSFL